MNRSLVVAFILFCLSVPVFGQFNEYQPEYDWKTIEGENVFVHFHNEAERTARTVAKIADEVWGPITSLYGYEPDPVHYVIKDIDDYSNGATYFFDNKIEIWASALDFDLRGTHNWLRNVISHEFTHMVQIQASMKLGRKIPAVYLQYLNYEEKRRPDILYGFPNFIASYPVATINMPAWLAEGTAQYMRKEFNYDNWDTHRDMILRSYVLDGNMLTWNQMGVFGKTSLGNESVYNAGFALTKYIAQKYGEDKLAKITKALGRKTTFTVDQAFEDVLGKDGVEIYNEWRDYLKESYGERIAKVKENLIEGEKLAEVGFGNFYPVFTKDGKVLYISNKTSDYFTSSIFQYDPETKKEELILFGVRSTVNYIPGTDKIIYAKISDDNPKWTSIHDLYVYDVKEKEETRLTHGLRANNPSVSHKGDKIVFIFQKDGTSNLGTVDINGKNFKQLTFFGHGEQVYNPKFSPDDSYIVFGQAFKHGRDIAAVDTTSENFRFILNTENDERNPVFGKDGKLYYSSDETGIYNIYVADPDSPEKSVRLTNVTGGAFMPDVNAEGDIVYAGYTSTGYKIFKVTEEVQKKVVENKSYERMTNPPLGKDDLYASAAFNHEPLRNYDDFDLPDYDVSDYSGQFTSLTLIPLLRIDNYNKEASFFDKVKPGLYVGSSDYLNRYALFAGGAINKQLEYDLFLNFEYRDKLPLLYSLGLKPQVTFEVFNVTRKASGMELLFDEYYIGDVKHYEDTAYTDVDYSLLEFDLAFKHRVFAAGSDLEFRFIFSRYIATLNSFILPDQNNTLYPTTKDEYFIGRNLQLKYNYLSILPDRDSDINPVGMEAEITYNYEFNKYNPDGNYEVKDGMLIPIYDNFNFHRLELDLKNHFGLFKDHTLSTRIRAATVFGPPVPDFFDYYLGGLVGMKAYPFYAVSGNELGWLNVTYRIPLLRDIDKRIGHLYLDKMFLSVHGDIGNAWTGGGVPNLDTFKKGAGLELRFALNSFYLFPTDIFFNASYAFDKVNGEYRGEKVSYGKEWHFYGGILFDFSL